MDYQGTLDQLVNSISAVASIAQTDERKSHTRILTNDGARVSWYPEKKRVYVQGNKSQVSLLRQQICTIPVSPTKDSTPEPAKAAPGYVYRRPKSSANAEPVTYTPDKDSELVIALVAAVGTDLSVITSVLTDRLKTFNYTSSQIKISNDIIAELRAVPNDPHFERISALMTEGNALRKQTGDHSVLAKLAAAKINEIRQHGRPRTELPPPMPRRAFIISSLKHPEEVAALRKIYANGFFLIGVHANKEMRHDYLYRNKNVPKELVTKLFERDEDEAEKHGQHTRDTYHLSDFFVDFGENRNKFEKDVWRVVDLVFGKPFVTPTFDEFAMFMAFSASLRSADLSRQVGAVVTKDHAIVSTGANDVPQFGGGLYWPGYYGGSEIKDAVDGRDYMRSGDTNVIEKNEIIEDILSKVPEEQRNELRKILTESKLKNITEYGRVVHAEMEAILSCARGNVATHGAHLYCTTFPCHNCAKHIIAAGVTKVVYVEPYPKSKAADFHDDSITLSSAENGKVVFEPFVGVGPRSFFNLFSVNLGTGYEIRRKTKDGKPVEWDAPQAVLRMQMLPTSYIERESITTSHVKTLLEKLK